MKKIFDEEAVGLEKRDGAGAETESARIVHQVAGAGEFESIFALVEQEQAIELRDGVSKDRGELGSRFGEAFERDVERDLLVFGIDEGFDFLESFRHVAGASEVLQLFECGVKRRT